MLALTCYVCEDSDDNVCVKEFDCPVGSNYCVTVESGKAAQASSALADCFLLLSRLTCLSGGVISSRTCEATCPSGTDTNCCQEDLC